MSLVVANNSGASAASPVLDIVIENYKFRLIGKSELGKTSNQFILIESVNLANNSDKPVQFAVYRSVSQVIWRLSIIDGEGLLQKFSDYTCTTQIHPELQKFIESVLDNVPIVDANTIHIGLYNFEYYYNLIKHDLEQNNKKDRRKYNSEDTKYQEEVFMYFDKNRILNDSNFELLSSGIFDPLIQRIDNMTISAFLENIPNAIDLVFKYYDNFPRDVAKYFPIDSETGEYDNIEVRKRIAIMAEYLSDKLKVVPRTECLEYYIDPNVSIISVINYEENIDQYAYESKLFIVDPLTFFRTTGGKSKLFESINPNKRYLAIRKAAGKTFKNNMIKNEDDKIYAHSYVSLYDRSPAVLSVKLQSHATPKDTYTLYYFDYKYRGRRYKIPINIIKDGIAINKFGLPEKYIKLHLYAGKILEYLEQVELYEGNTYDIYHISDSDRKYAFVGDLYHRVWPLTEVTSLAKVAKQPPCKHNGPKTQKRRIKRSKSNKKSFKTSVASNSENER